MMLRKPLYSILLALALGVSGFFLGWLVAPRGGEEAAPVRIQASSVDGESQFLTIPLDAAQQGFQHLTYYGVQDVTVTLDGRTMPLEQALSEQRLTLDALIAQVRQDARQGICQEDSRSDQGLTRFIYHYPDFDLLYIHDLYETPKGKQEQIAEFALCKTGLTPHFFYMDEETGEPIDYESWGLRLRLEDLSQETLSVTCTQSGGQQVGSLAVYSFSLFRKQPDSEEEQIVSPLDSSDPLPEPVMLNMGGETTLTVPLSQMYGPLAPGEYLLYFQIQDMYNKEDLRPLQRNYRDIQVYPVSFTIPE